MQKTPSNVASVLASTVFAASVTLLLGWPSRVNAVGEDEQATQQQAALAKEQAAPTNAALAKNESKIGDLEVTATLTTSETTPGRQVIRMECRNSTEGRIAGKIQVALTRTNGNSMERVMPRPQIAWRHPEAVEVAPGETLVREVALPKSIGAEVARIEKARKAAETSDTAAYPKVYYGVTAEALEATGGTPNVKNRALMQKVSLSNHHMLSGPEFGY